MRNLPVGRLFAVLVLWIAFAAWGCGDGHDTYSGELRGYVFVSRAQGPFVVEIDTQWGSRAVALSVGLTGRPAGGSKAAWSADGTQLAYLVRTDGDSWLGVAAAPDWTRPLAGWSIAGELRAYSVSWLNDHELVVALAEGAHHQRYALAETQPEELGWFSPTYEAQETWLGRDQESTNYLLLRATGAAHKVEVDTKTWAYLAPDGMQAAFVANSAVPQVATEGLEVTPIDWRAPPPPVQESCNTERPSCPIINAPFSSVTAVRFTPDHARVVVKVQMTAGSLNVDRMTSPFPHASGYSLSVAEAGRPLILDGKQASRQPEVPVIGGAPEAESAPIRTFWAWGTPTSQSWGVLSDGRLYYTAWGNTAVGFEADPRESTVRVLPDVSATLDMARVFRARTRDASIYWASPTRDERWLLLIDWDSSAKRSSLTRVPLTDDVEPQADGQASLIFESARTVVHPQLAPSGGALVFGVADGGLPGNDCDGVVCSNISYYLARDPTEAHAAPLPAGLHEPSWTPDGAGVMGLLDGQLVYVATSAPATVQHLERAQEFLLPPLWATGPAVREKD